MIGILIKVMEAEETTAGGLLLTQGSKEKTLHWHGDCGWAFAFRLKYYVIRP
ncbi:hypothetical protein HanIR_Chr14g0686391 [Helianthus annuus]|nr:hypothetical protein HanIR_Chr14g0686391 [Helianthus annuus]